jgi:RND family efflux transporter MFP subunit
MDDTGKTLVKRLLFIIPVMAAVAVLVAVVKRGAGPEQAPPREVAAKVRIIAVPEVTLVPRALGYGNAEPGMVWEAVAQVDGRIVAIHQQLKEGAILGKGEVLVRIDPNTYELAVRQMQANIRSVEAQLAEIRVKEENTRASLAIEERSVTLSERDLERKRRLLRNKNVSEAAVDEQERAVLGGWQSVQSLRNTLNLIPAERDSLRAQLALFQAQLETARLDLERTTIRAPFNCRIAEVHVEQTQFAAKGKVLVVADSTDVSEVAAQLPVGKMVNLIPPGMKIPTEPGAIMRNLPEILPLKAEVRLRGGTLDARWQARFARINDAIDPKTRTVGIIVAVDDPYRQAIPGVRPPLVKGMFVEVELSGEPRPGQVVVPRAALHDGHAYVVDENKRLRKRAVVVAFRQSNFAVVKSGLDAGDTIVISDVVPAIEGMLLEPVADDGAARALADEAEGRGPVR